MDQAISGTFVYIKENLNAVAWDAAETFVRLTKQAAADGRVFIVALSGGSTPQALYGLLTSDQYRNEIPWDNIQFFFGDERWVPHDDPNSNYKLANDELFTKVGVNPANVFPIPTEGLTPQESARQYEDTLRKVFGLGPSEAPAFDLIFLGMGEDGHTASCFPYTDVITEYKKLVDCPFVPKLNAYRITLTPVVLQAAIRVIFMVAGEDKASVLRDVLEGHYNPEMYPSQLLRDATGQVIWLVDRASASQLVNRYPRV